MDTIPRRRSGRPKKPESEKVQYQRIAVYLQDYQKLVESVDNRGVRLTDAFTEMVNNYVK